MKEEILKSIRKRLEMISSSRMFGTVKSTCNVLKGCNHNCAYCNVRKTLIPRLRKASKRYEDGFQAGFVEEEFKNPSYKRSDPGLVFICYMGDSMCSAMKDEWILKAIELTKRDSNNYFLWCSKNPIRYNDFLDCFPENTVLGTTIETNIRELSMKYSDAPPVDERYEAMRKLNWHTKFLSIEPKMNCYPQTMIDWTEKMGINIVEVGADNYHNNLPEPSPRRVRDLFEGLRSVCEIVVEKKGIERLLQRR